MKRFLFVGLVACTPSPRDVAEPGESHVVTVDAGNNSADAYVYVARRPHGAVGLAEARSMKDEEARAFVDRIADELERCTSALEPQHLVVEGAARIIAVAQGPGGAPAVNLKLAPGDAVAQNALLCLVAPIRATMLPPGSSLAIEATWRPRTAP